MSCIRFPAPFPNKTIVLQMPLQTFERYYTDEQFICFTHSERVQDEQLVELVEKMYVTYQKKKTGYELKVQSYFLYAGLSDGDKIQEG